MDMYSGESGIVVSRRVGEQLLLIILSSVILER